MCEQCFRVSACGLGVSCLHRPNIVDRKTRTQGQNNCECCSHRKPSEKQTEAKKDFLQSLSHFIPSGGKPSKNAPNPSNHHGHQRAVCTSHDVQPTPTLHVYLFSTVIGPGGVHNLGAATLRYAIRCRALQQGCSAAQLPMGIDCASCKA
jgi:hypothetical protein